MPQQMFKCFMAQTFLEGEGSPTLKNRPEAAAGGCELALWSPVLCGPKYYTILNKFKCTKLALWSPVLYNFEQI